MAFRTKVVTGDVRINPLTGKPISAADVLDDPEFKVFTSRVIGELVPKLQASRVTMTLVPKGELDVKFAVELGLSIMLNKPIIACVAAGQPIPDKLRLVADEVVEMPDNFKTNKRFQRELMAALERIRRLAE